METHRCFIAVNHQSPSENLATWNNQKLRVFLNTSWNNYMILPSTNVVKTIINHSQTLHLYGWYKPSKMGWFIFNHVTSVFLFYDAVLTAKDFFRSSAVCIGLLFRVSLKAGSTSSRYTWNILKDILKNGSTLNITYTGVSINKCWYPKWMVYKGKSIYKWMIWG